MFGCAVAVAGFLCLLGWAEEVVGGVVGGESGHAVSATVLFWGRKRGNDGINERAEVLMKKKKRKKQVG